MDSFRASYANLFLIKFSERFPRTSEELIKGRHRGLGEDYLYMDTGMSVEQAEIPVGNRRVDKKPASNTYESSYMLVNMGVDVREAVLPMAVDEADLHETWRKLICS